MAEPSDAVHPRHDEQVQRERAQRDIALGRRVQSLTEGQGHTGTVVKRWVNGSVVPVAARLRAVAGAFLDGDTHTTSQLLDSPLFGLAEFEGDGHQDLGPVMRWLLKGGSPGRVAKGETHTYAEDLVLAAMGVVLERLVKASRGDNPVTMALVLHLAADALRETAIGQFLTTVQGADAMQAVRQRGPKGSWQQRNKLDQVAMLMGSQVKSSLEAELRGEIDLEKVGGRRILRVTEVDTRDGSMRLRRISLRPPASGDFDLLKLASRPKGERDPHRQTWNSLAMMVLCAAQAEGGWFDIVGVKPRNSHGKTRRPTKCLVLSERAQEAVEGDLQRWLEGAGMMLEPMVCPPVEGDYLTVRRRAVTGRPGPMGLRTNAEGTRSWRAAVDVLAGSPWAVHSALLAAIREDPRVEALAARSEPDEGRRATILAGYRKVAQEPAFWLPIQLDFRGRMYPKTTWVTYQGTDLQKGLMCWPEEWQPEPGTASDTTQAVILHAAALYGHGLDKAPFSARAWWYEAAIKEDPVTIAEQAEEPLALLAALMLIHAGHSDRVAIQIDGTCNGLQHLSALFRDERAAGWVNLGETTLDDKPSDLYLAVAARVSALLGDAGEGWKMRLAAARVLIDRKLAKKPVMVLPYGGTRVTIHDAVQDAVLGQLELRDTGANGTPWDVLKYAAFRDRPLEDHPLFRADCRALGDLVYDAIGEVIPKAMLAMAAFRKIAKKVGERALEWRVGSHEDDLWVVHAYAQSATSRTTLKGFHLPNSVRSLAMRVGRDEIDKGKHASGIVANYIHSLDSVHLARTAARFRELVQSSAGAQPAGGTNFGAIHDCLLARPSETHLLARAVRETFKEMYEEDPLSWPVRIREPKSGELEEYASWYALAEAFGVELPEMGTWEPAEVMDSAWFFS